MVFFEKKRKLQEQSWLHDIILQKLKDDFYHCPECRPNTTHSRTRSLQWQNANHHCRTKINRFISKQGRAKMNKIFLFLTLITLSIHATEIYIHYDAKWGNSITLRGDASSLNWEQGQPAQSISANLWKIKVDDNNFAFKPLINDKVWSIGKNYQVQGEEVIHIYPFFSQHQRNSKESSRIRLANPQQYPNTTHISTTKLQ